jgi:hypothetical protein
MRKFNKKIAIAVAASIAVVGIGGGVAFAYWTTTGTGTGSATNATTNGTVVLHASYANNLTPGASETVTYAADNGGTSSLFVGTITPVVSIDSAHAFDATTNPAGCKAADFTIGTTSSNTTVPAHGSGVAAGTGLLTFTDTSSNQDGCKGAVVTLSLSSN